MAGGEVTRRNVPPARAGRSLAARHRAEWWLRVAGLGALLFAGAALLALVGSVAGRAVHALTETYLRVDLDLADFDGDAESWLRASLRENIPEASGRRQRRELAALVSIGAVFELPEQVAALPPGGPGVVRLPVLASDHVDLYRKGQLAPLRTAAGDFPVRLETHDDGFRLLADGGGDFGVALAPFRDRLGDLAGRREAAAARQSAAAGRVAAAGGGEAGAEGAEAARYREQADALGREALALRARAAAPDLDIEADAEMPSILVRIAGGVLRAERLRSDSLHLSVIRAPSAVGPVAAGAWELWVNKVPEGWRSITDRQIGWFESLAAAGRVETRFNWRFFRSGNSREAELAGILGAVAGSFWTMLVTLVLACPIGVFAALYLEEFAPRNRVTDFIEVNINNLAAVPSIVFGLLGLAAFIQFFGLPRSVPLVGGMVLALMTLPTVIIASRASIRAVPGSIRDAALGVGASRVQTVFHHVLPLAVPGILTGTIIGMAQALGETAPLLLIGMVAFIVGTSGGVLEPASALPVQIFQWSDFPEVAFSNKAALAILTLILFLVAMNALAVFLRHRFERRW